MFTVVGTARGRCHPLGARVSPLPTHRDAALSACSGTAAIDAVFEPLKSYPARAKTLGGNVSCAQWHLNEPKTLGQSAVSTVQVHRIGCRRDFGWRTSHGIVTVGRGENIQIAITIHIGGMNTVGIIG